VYTNPRPSAELLGKFYAQSANYEYWNNYIFPASEKTRRERIFKPRVDKILNFCKKYNAATNSILEVGAGFGTFCEELASRTIFEKIVAIEPTPSLAATCRQKGITTIEKPIEEIQLSENDKFDVVVNFEVIEHLFSPFDFINHCKKLLKPNGLFVVTCPNGLGFDIITLKEISNTIDHEHVNYFNPESLSLLLEKCGFEILEASTPGVLDADLVRNAVLENKYSLENQSFLKTILIDQWEKLGGNFQDYLIENKLSSNMWIVAKSK
jgi:2-polyprenyl-3-methyl-5-hydroxy-6-metoxy-1,4-benzoquinol methylase